MPDRRVCAAGINGPDVADGAQIIRFGAKYRLGQLRACVPRQVVRNTCPRGGPVTWLAGSRQGDPGSARVLGAGPDPDWRARHRGSVVVIPPCHDAGSPNVGATLAQPPWACRSFSSPALRPRCR